MSRVTVSFSGMQLYDQCPSAFNRRYILKEDVEDVPAGKALKRGKRVHFECERFLLGKGALPDEALSFEGLFHALKDERAARPEVEWAFDEDWGAVEFDDPSAMVRGVLDIVYEFGGEAYVMELKTGKKYEEHNLQRSLYGLAGLLMHPEASRVNVTTIYLDGAQTEDTTMMAGQTESYQWVWMRYINKCQPPQPYPQRPSFKCRWCPYHADNGGNCNGERTG